MVDKPVGWTSFDVVAKVRNVLRSSQVSVVSIQSRKQTTDDGLQITPSRKVKVGHTGTLDPLATGLLVILVGSYTKRADEYTKMDKVYDVTMRLGQTSTTGDEEGVKTQVSTHKPTQKELQAVIEQFIGEIMQTPPQFSAIKVDGQRAYKLARAGKAVKLEPRKVTITRLNVTHFDYPTVQFTAEVSSGTYIRSLVEDIGKQLGTGAYMTALRRTNVGKFKIDDAIDPKNIAAATISTGLKSEQ